MKLMINIFFFLEKTVDQVLNREKKIPNLSAVNAQWHILISLAYVVAFYV